MDESQLPRLRKVALQVIRAANRPGGSLERGQFTLKVARRDIALKMGLGEDGLDEKKWKELVKGLVAKGVQEVADEASSDQSEGSQASSSRIAPAKPIKSKSSTTKDTRRPDTGRKGKSPELHSEEEDEGKTAVSEDESRKLRSEMSSVYDVPPTRKRKSKGKDKETSDIRVAKPKAPRGKNEAEVSETEGGAKEKEVIEVMSESEISSVYDIPPSRKRKSKGPENGDSKRKGSKKAIDSDVDDVDVSGKRRKKSNTSQKTSRKQPADDLSPDEAKIAELKKIIVACGVRKQWSKEFEAYDTESKQIRHLESILHDLGMRGTPTLGKAKSVKEKRELAAELNDVKEFEASRGRNASTARASRSGAKKKKIDSDDEDDDAEDSGEKEQSALGAVLDFLGGESD